MYEEYALKAPPLYRKIIPIADNKAMMPKMHAQTITPTKHLNKNMIMKDITTAIATPMSM